MNKQLPTLDDILLDAKPCISASDLVEYFHGKTIEEVINQIIERPMFSQECFENVGICAFKFYMAALLQFHGYVENLKDTDEALQFCIQLRTPELNK